MPEKPPPIPHVKKDEKEHPVIQSLSEGYRHAIKTADAVGAGPLTGKQFFEAFTGERASDVLQQRLDRRKKRKERIRGLFAT